MSLAHIIRNKKIVSDLAYLGILGAEKISNKTYVSNGIYIVLSGGSAPVEKRYGRVFRYENLYVCIEVYGRSIAVPGTKTEYLSIVSGSSKYLCLPISTRIQKHDIALGIYFGDEAYIVHDAYKLYNVLKRKRWKQGEIADETYIVLDYGVLKLYVPVKIRHGHVAPSVFKVYFY